VRLEPKQRKSAAVTDSGPARVAIREGFKISPAAARPPFKLKTINGAFSDPRLIGTSHLLDCVDLVLLGAGRRRDQLTLSS